MKKVLLDENLPRQLKSYFSSKLDVTTVPDLGWQSKENGELLSAMSAEGISYLVTADHNLQFQQNLNKYDISIVVIRSFDIRLKALKPFIDEIEAKILNAEPSDSLIEIDLRRR